jgi:hypothetical protein
MADRSGHEPSDVLAHPAHATLAWLTRALTESGALTQGAVIGADVGLGHGNWSTNARLTLHYSPGSNGERPVQLFLKLVHADLGDESFGPSEVYYYTRDYVDVPHAPLLRCYAAAYSAEHSRYHLLLEDVTATHVRAGTKAPTLGYGLALAEGLAALHAHWWGAERLAEAGAPIHDAAHILRFVDLAEPGAAHIVNGFSNELKAHWPDALRRLFATHAERLTARAQDARGFTLIHGDVGDANILVPRDDDRPLYVIDRQPFNWSLTTWLGVYDLAYAMVLDWPIETRRQLEQPVLRHYHACLQQHDVAGYTWDQLLDDYRLCLETCVTVAVEYCRGGVNQRWVPVWLPMLQRALTACNDYA